MSPGLIDRVLTTLDSHRWSPRRSCSDIVSPQRDGHVVLRREQRGSDGGLGVAIVTTRSCRSSGRAPSIGADAVRGSRGPGGLPTIGSRAPGRRHAAVPWRPPRRTPPGSAMSTGLRTRAAVPARGAHRSSAPAADREARAPRPSAWRRRCSQRRWRSRAARAAPASAVTEICAAGARAGLSAARRRSPRR